MMNRYTLVILTLLTVATGSTAQELTLPEAIAAQRALVDQHPGEAKLFNDLGNLLLLVGDRQGAEDAYRQAIQLDSDMVSAYFNLGLLLQQTQRPAKAQREFRKLLKIQPDHAWSLYQLGVLSERQGKRNTAIRRYAEALRLEPRLTDPAYNPHILDNHLAASATLRAYADLSSADLVPRTYEAPRRIAGLLVPLPPTSEDQTPAVKPRRKKGGKRRGKKDAKPQQATEQAPPAETSPATKGTQDREPKPPIRRQQPRKPSDS